MLFRSSGIFGSLQNVTQIGNTTTLGITTSALQLNLTSAVTVSQGQMAWNAADLTVDVGMGNGVTLQLGQEQYIKVKASEDISDGQTVMFSGADGEHILAARCNTAVSGFKPEWFIGVATQDLVRNGFGYITTFGKVHGLNTLAFAEGDILYVDANNVGAMVNTPPTLPRPQITVAAVTKRAGGDGHIMVRPTFTSTTAINTYMNVMAAFDKANSAGVAANTPSYTANSAASYANSAFLVANNAFTSANGTIVWNTANAAFTRANNSINANTGGSITGQLNVTYAPATTTGAVLNISGANTQGGTGYLDFLKATNASGGATNPKIGRAHV